MTGTTTSMSTLHTNYDVGDIVQKRVSLESLDLAEKIKYVENHFHPSPPYQHFCTQVVDKGTQCPKALMFQSSWLDQYNWLVYSASDAGGYCPDSIPTLAQCWLTLYTTMAHGRHTTLDQCSLDRWRMVG